MLHDLEKFYTKIHCGKKNDFTSTFPENLPGPCNAKIEVVRLFRVSLFLLIIRSGVAVATSSWLVIAGKTG